MDKCFQFSCNAPMSLLWNIIFIFESYKWLQHNTCEAQGLTVQVHEKHHDFCNDNNTAVLRSAL